MKFQVTVRTSGCNKPEINVQIQHAGYVIASSSDVQSRTTGLPTPRGLAELLVQQLEAEVASLRRQLEEIK